MAKRKIYLEDVPLDEAYRRFWMALGQAGSAEPLPGELVLVVEALGRVTAAPVWGPSSPLRTITPPPWTASPCDLPPP